MFGADGIPSDALWIRVVRSPYDRSRFALGDLAPLRRRLAAVLTAADVPFNGFGIYPEIKDQPVLADGIVHAVVPEEVAAHEGPSGGPPTGVAAECVRRIRFHCCAGV